MHMNMITDDLADLIIIIHVVVFNHDSVWSIEPS